MDNDFLTNKGTKQVINYNYFFHADNDAPPISNFTRKRGGMGRSLGSH
jgi:hypothetical protein